VPISLDSVVQFCFYDLFFTFFFCFFQLSKTSYTDGVSNLATMSTLRSGRYRQKYRHLLIVINFLVIFNYQLFGVIVVVCINSGDVASRANRAVCVFTLVKERVLKIGDKTKHRIWKINISESEVLKTKGLVYWVENVGS